ETAKGQISYADRLIGSRGGYSYTIHYKFQLPDKSQRTGSSFGSTRSSDGPRGSMNIRYYKFYPNYNHADSSLLVLWFILWSGCGAGIIIINARKLKNLKSKSSLSPAKAIILTGVILIAVAGIAY